MIFCKSRKFIFLRVPKTASTSLSMQIQKHLDFRPGDFATKFSVFGYPIPSVGIEHLKLNYNPIEITSFKEDEHMQLSRLELFNIINPEELDSYSIYGVLRNPVDRFFSLFSHMITTRQEFGLNVEKMTKEEIASFAFYRLKQAKINGTDYSYPARVEGRYEFIPMHQQAKWLVYRNKIINNIIVYPKFDEFLTHLNGNSELQFREKIGKKPINSPISDSTLKEIKYWYPEDFDLWERFGYNK